MNSFKLKSIDGPDQEMTVVIGNDGDVHITIWDYEERFHQMIPHNIRIGMSPNSGDPNDNVEDIKYLKAAIRDLAKEFQYQNGEISKEEILKYRNAPKVRPFEEKWYDD